MKILDLDLPDRVKRCLIRSRIETLEKLLELSCDDLLKVRNLGTKGYTQLMAFLEYNGLQMKDGIRYIGNVDDYRKRLLEEMKGKPVLGRSFNANEETPDPYEISQENEVLWRRVMRLEQKVEYLTEKCLHRKKILEALARCFDDEIYEATGEQQIMIFVEKGKKEYETIKGWLDEN